MTAAVFLDRDNTIIHNDGDLGDPAQVRLIQGAASAIASLKGLGYRIIVVTNQGGVARGKYTEADVDRVNERINDLMKANSGVFVDRFYYCPYHPEGTVDRYRRDHPWRKPRPGMLLQAARDLGLDLRQSWMIGDQMRDVVAGYSAGAIPILLAVDGATPPPTAALPPPGAGDDRGGSSGAGSAPKTVLIEPARDFFVVRSLIEAVRLVGQKSRPTNVTAAMKTERIEVIPRPQPRVATASFDASNVPVVGQEQVVLAAAPQPVQMNAGGAGAATAEVGGAGGVIKSVAFADLATQPVREVEKELGDASPTPRRKRTEKSKVQESGGTKAAGRTDESSQTGASSVIEAKVKTESKPETKPETKLETKVEPRPPLAASRPVTEDQAVAPRVELVAMPTVASLPTAEMKPARVPPGKRRDDDHAEPAAMPAPIETQSPATVAEAARVPAEPSTIAESIAESPSSPASPARPTKSPSNPETTASSSLPAEQTLRQILQELRSQRKVVGDFNYITIMAIVLQMVAIVCLMGGLLMGAGNNDIFMRWIACAIIMQLATLATLLFRK